jgi:hypothetical protein
MAHSILCTVVHVRIIYLVSSFGSVSVQSSLGFGAYIVPTNCYPCALTATCKIVDGSVVFLVQGLGSAYSIRYRRLG